MSFKGSFAKIAFYYMAKGLDKLVQIDSSVAKRLDIVPNGTKIKIAIFGGEQLVLQKCADGLKSTKNVDKIDLAITFKTFKSLANIIFGTSSIKDCYFAEEFFVQGELRYAVAMVYAFERFMAYLLQKKKYEKIYNTECVRLISKSKMLVCLMFATRRRI